MKISFLNQSFKDYIDKYRKIISQFSLSDYPFLRTLKDEQFIREIYLKVLKTATELANCTDALVIVGIGGSILLSRGILQGQNCNNVYFLGQGLDFDAFDKTLKMLKGKKLSLAFISKSGTTIECKLMFEYLKNFVEKENIVVISSKNSQIYKDAEKVDISCFEIPESVGGRFSFFTPVGMFPLAYAKLDFLKFYNGFLQEIKSFENDIFNSNEFSYACARKELSSNFQVESVISFDYKIQSLLPCICQLLAESLGKENKGIYPSPCYFSEDLHSIGQFMQEGKKCFFETFITCAKDEKNNSKNFNFNDEINNIKSIYKKYNSIACNSSIKAHADGGNKIINIELDSLSEEECGRLIAFFILSVLLYAKLDGVNPLNQGGVENYKSNMKKFLNE